MSTTNHKYLNHTQTQKLLKRNRQTHQTNITQILLRNLNVNFKRKHRQLKLLRHSQR